MAVIGSVEAQRQAEARARHRGADAPSPAATLRHYLATEYAAGVPLRLTTRARSSSVGQALADRLVSRLEIANAVTTLPERQRRVIELLYGLGLSIRRAARALSVSERTLHYERAAALESMVGVIFEVHDAG